VPIIVIHLNCLKVYITTSPFFFFACPKEKEVKRKDSPSLVLLTAGYSALLIKK
jgi:hypothetical protein